MMPTFVDGILVYGVIGIVCLAIGILLYALIRKSRFEEGGEI
jgi:hypothetical protein